MVTSEENSLAISSSYTTRPVDFSKAASLYENTIPGLVSSWTLSAEADSVPFEGSLTDTSLNMFNGMCTTQVTFQDDIIVQLDRYAHRTLAYTTMQTIVVTNGAAYNVSVKNMVHLPDNDHRLANFRFSGNYLATSGDSQYIMLADGIISDSQKPICVGVLYTIADPSVSSIKGFQMLSKSGREYGAFPIFEVAAGFPATFHAMTVTMTGHDFADPRTEVMRALMSISKLNTPESLRVQHSLAWAQLWRADILITPDYTSSDVDQVLDVKRVVRTCIYVLYSVVRAASSSIITLGTPNVTSVDSGAIDTTGSVIGGDDMWVLGALTLLSPPMAQSLLSFRYNELSVAVSSARQLGYAGARFPLSTDPIALTAYSSTWAPTTDALIYNSALVAIHAWNYYRVTQDSDYLETIGYPIIRGVAQFIASRVSAEEEPTGTFYHMVDVTNLDGEVVRNDFSTVFLSRLALKYANEAMIALSKSKDQTWNDISTAGLRQQYLDSDAGVLLPFTNFEEGDPFVFPTTLFPLHPFFYDGFTRLNYNTFNDQSYVSNFEFVVSKYDTDENVYPDDVFHIIAAVAARVINVTRDIDPAREDATALFDSYFYKMVDKLRDTPMPSLDPRTCCGFLLTVLSVCGVYINGGVDSAGIYAPFSVVRNSISNLPSGWNDVTLKLATSFSKIETSTVINANV